MNRIMKKIIYFVILAPLMFGFLVQVRGSSKNYSTDTSNSTVSLQETEFQRFCNECVVDKQFCKCEVRSYYYNYAIICDGTTYLPKEFPNIFKRNDSYCDN